MRNFKLLFTVTLHWIVPWKCINLYYMKSQTNEQNLSMSKIFAVKKALYFDILRSYCFDSVTVAFFLTETFFCGKTNSVMDTFFLWQQLFPCSMTKICFSDGNLDRNLFLWKKLVPWKNFFMWQNLRDICFCHKKFFSSVTVTFFCDHNLFCQKYAVLAFYTCCLGKSFHEKWESPLSLIL